MTYINPHRNDGVTNVRRIRSGQSEVATAVELRYREVLIRKGPDAIDSTICLSVDEAKLMIESLENQIKYIDHHRKTPTCPECLAAFATTWLYTNHVCPTPRHTTSRRIK